MLLAAPNPVLVLLPNPLPPPKPVFAGVVLPKRGAEDVFVLPKAGLFWPKIDEVVLFVDPNAAKD